MAENGDFPAADGNQAAAIQPVTVKLPPFYTTNPKFWFGHAEAQFNLRGITQDNTRYFYVVANLPEEAAVRVMRVIEEPPAADKYDTIKAALLKAYTPSDEENAAALLDMPGLGDMKPSQLWQRMCAMHPADQKPNFLARELFLRQLPADVRGHLADKKDLTNDQLAEEADKFFASSGRQIQSARYKRGNRFSFHSPTRRRSKSPPSSVRSGSPHPFCFFHQKFGKKARNCRPPCSFRAGN